MTTYNKWGRWIRTDNIEEIQSIDPVLYPSCLLRLACEIGSDSMVKYLLQFFKAELDYLSYIVKRRDEDKKEVAHLIIKHLSPPFSENKVKKVLNDCRFWGEYEISFRLRQKTDSFFY